MDNLEYELALQRKEEECEQLREALRREKQRGDDLQERLNVIQKMLKERPKIAGIAVPGMPAGSPGMESPYPEAYDVVAFDASGKTSVYAKKAPK